MLASAMAWILIIGCQSNGVVVFEIDGADTIDEVSETLFRISASMGENAEFSWSVDPTGAGEFSDPNSPETKFYSGIFDADTTVWIITCL